MSTAPNPANADLPPPLRQLPAEQVELLRQYFLQTTFCPRCELPQDQRAVQPSEEDKKEFLKAILGDGIFTKTYLLCEGKVKLVFRSLTTAQSLLLSESSKTIPDLNPYDQNVALLRIKLLFYLAERNGTKFELPAQMTFEEIREAYLERFGQWNEALLALSLGALQQFIRLEELLMQGGLDKAFWKSAGLV
jgi:hypothetical protein